MCLRDRGGRRRDFHDLGVNTRQTMVHVQESKTGMFKLDCRHVSSLKWRTFLYFCSSFPLKSQVKKNLQSVLEKDKKLLLVPEEDHGVLSWQLKAVQKAPEGG